MSEINSRATATIEVNGKQVEQELAKLKKKAEDLRDALVQAYKTGDTTAQKNLQKELNKTEKQIRKVQSEMVNVEQTLKRLDKATPKELQQTLRSLERDLKNIERGSKAWDEQTKKIKAVRTELAKIKAETKEHTSLWDRFAKKMFDWGAAIQTVMASITGITMTARQAVNAYAQMEQEEANVRKYTGMTADEVARLNEEFKKMDTRSSREQLNQLAQEAGRLGMQTQEDVLGFVRAADQINVALDELGEGATLTLSKLTDIFGDKQRLGVEKSLLSVGSVINELSQNCTASAPYLAEFASRMGGVGAQAGMTIQQIMAFGAVLDSNNQKVEASATAVSQVITRLYQDPAKYARVAGLDIQRFSELVRTDANEALLTLLQTLNQAGGMEKLAPMFKDMGENGARAISALSTLAKHIDDVRAQQLAANQAFEEGTSVSKEFNVQNNTVQAGLEKAKKSFNEMAIELGQKLAPLMKYAITSGSAMMKVLSAVINYVSKNIGLIASLTAAIIAYTIATNAATIATKAMNVAVAAGRALFAVGRAGILAFAAAINLFRGNTIRATAAWRLFSMALKANPIGLIAAAVTLLIAGLYKLGNAMQNAQNRAIAAKKAQDEYRRALVNFSQQAVDSANKEMAALKTLYAVATSEVYTREKRVEAVKKLQGMYPAYFANMSQEAIMAGQASTQYKELVKNIYEVAMARAAAAKIEENAGKILDLQMQAESLKNQQREADERYKKARENTKDASTPKPDRRGKMKWSYNDYRSAQQKEDEALQETTNVSMQVGSLYSQIGALTKANQDIVKRVPEAAKYLTGTTGTTTGSGAGGAGGSGSGSVGSGSTSNTDKLAAEKAWREKEIALAKIEWLKGETDAEEHRKKLEKIDVDYYAKVLERTDLSEQERLDVTVKHLEAQKKQTESAHAATIQMENDAYAERIALLQEDYLQGRISKEAYDMKMEQEEIDHLYELKEIAKVGTEERVKAEAAYRQKLIAEQQKRQQEYERKEKEHQDELKRIKDEYFGNNAAENKALYDAALANLQQVYNAELAAAGDNAKEKLRIEKAFLAAKAALRKKFNQDDQTENQNFLQAWGQSVNEWLESDMGKAVTGTMEVVTNAMSSLFSQMSTLIQAETEIQVAAIERRYETEVSRAEGNKAKVNAIEKRKEKETAKVKNEAARKQMSMQVIQAIAQTATAALNAYSSAAAVPVIGYILAPIAAAMAVAAGMMQVAAIKKQQQAQEAQGYAQGGFTPAGPKDKPVGIVHAGEWVASQELLANPVARPAINALDYAQRHNTIGSLRATDVSRSVTANQVVARVAAEDNGMTVMAASVAVYADTMRQLRERLNEPFVTVNTIEGDTGIKQAQDEYQRLMNNTLPKSKRK